MQIILIFVKFCNMFLNINVFDANDPSGDNNKMINNQLYLEVKGKWKSVYPIYFDSTKTIAEGNTILNKGVDYLKIFLLIIQLYKN